MGACGTTVQVMVISLGAGTHVFQLDRALGEFVLTKNSIKMPARGGCDRGRTIASILLVEAPVLPTGVSGLLQRSAPKPNHASVHHRVGRSFLLCYEPA